MTHAARHRIRRYAFVLLACGLAVLVTELLKPVTSRAPSLLFLTAVIVSAWYGGHGPGLLAAVIVVLVINYGFEPLPGGERLDALDLLRLIMFVTVATVVSFLSGARRRAEGALRTRERQQAAIAQVGQRALSAADPVELMGEAVRLVADALRVEYCRLLELAPDGRTLLLRAAAGLADGLVGRASVVAAEDEQIGRTIASGAPVVLEQFRGNGGAPPFASSASVTVHAGGRPFGVLAADSREPRDFTDDDVNFLQAMANVLSTAIDRQRGERALRESEARTRAVLSNAADAIITVDEAGVVESVNPAAERLFGYAARELTGTSGRALLAEPFRSYYAAFLRLARMEELGTRRRGAAAGVAAEGVPPAAVTTGGPREIAGMRRDGGAFPMELVVNAIHLGDRLLFTGFARDVSDRKQREKEILEVTDRERRRIGQDLHDGLGQHLAGISFMSNALKQRLAAQSLPEATDIDKIEGLVNQAIARARTLARGLYPVELQVRGLGSALADLAENLRSVFGVDCTCDAAAAPLVTDETTATHLFRIAQEAANNAVRHGRATRVHLALTEAERALTLAVEDNGIGFTEPAEPYRGMGLRTMHYRSRVIGGALRIQRGPAGGTQVSCVCPLGGSPRGRAIS